MNFRYVLLILSLMMLVSNTNDASFDKDGYFTIEEDSLYDFLQNEKNVVVYFRKQDNTQKEQYDKEFMKAVQNKSGQHNFSLCKVNTSNNDLPDFRLYQNGFYRDYDFQPQFQRILSWSKLNFQRKSKVQKLTQNLLRLAKKSANYLVFKYPKEDKNFLQIIEDLSKIKIETKVYYTDENFDLNFNDKSYQMIIGRNFDSENKIFSQDTPFQPSIIQELYELHSRPHVQIYNAEHHNKVFEGKKVIIYFDKITQNEQTEYAKISAQFSSKIIFYLTDMSNESSIQFSRFLGVNKEDLPTVRGVQYKIKERKLKKFKPNTDQSIEDFIRSFKNDKQQDYMKEEPVLEHEKNYLFKKIVRGNFEEVVFDKNKHVLVAFVTDWCQHCKEIKPAFNEIKTILKDDVKDIVFGIINVDKNDIDINFKNFPTIYFYKKGQKDKPVNYDGMRDAEVILNFIETELGGNRAIYNRKMPEELKKKQEEMEQKVKEQQQQQEDNEDYDL